MGKITWNDDQNTFTIIKKIQIIIIEALQECWLRRCKKLHSQELSGDAINILRDRAETKWKHISTKSQKPATSTPTITTKERNFLSHNCTLMNIQQTPEKQPTPTPIPKRKTHPRSSYNLKPIYPTDEQDSSEGGRGPAENDAADEDDEDLLQPLWEKRHKPPEGQTPKRSTREDVIDRGKKNLLEGNGGEARRTADGAPAVPEGTPSSRK